MKSLLYRLKIIFFLTLITVTMSFSMEKRDEEQVIFCHACSKEFKKIDGLFASGFWFCSCSVEHFRRLFCKECFREMRRPLYCPECNMELRCEYICPHPTLTLAPGTLTTIQEDQEA